MKKIIGLLKKCALFNDIEEHNLEAMLGCLGAEYKKYNKKEVILAEGSLAIYIGIVLRGAVQLVQVDYFGLILLRQRMQRCSLLIVGES